MTSPPRPKRACTVQRQQPDGAGAPSTTTLPFASVVWAALDGAAPWPCMLVNPAHPRHLPAEVVRELEEGSGDLVWSLGATGGFFVSQRVNLFELPLPRAREDASLAWREAVAEAEWILVGVPLEQRVAGKRKVVLAGSGLPLVLEASPSPKEPPKEGTTVSPSSKPRSRPVRAGITAAGPRRQLECSSCHMMFMHYSMSVTPPTCPTCAVCQFCASGGEQSNLLLCDKCGMGEHVFCSPLAMDDAALEGIEDESKEHVCAKCQTAALPEYRDRVMFRRVHNDSMRLREQFLWNGEWLDEAPSPQHLAEFLASPMYQTSLSLGVSSGLTAFPRNLEGGAVDWVFPSGTRLGITQIPNFLPVEVLEAMETRLRDLILPSSTAATEAAEATTTLRDRFAAMPNTVDASLATKRLKLFFGFRYSYGAGLTGPGAQEALYADVAPIDETWKSHVTHHVEAAVHGLFPQKQAWGVNQVVVNAYLEPGATLGVHVDSAKLFHRPICSLRLWHDSVLSFGCSGFAGTETAAFLGIPLARNTLTIMHGFAADRLKHCIQGKHVRGLTASVLFRHVRSEVPGNVCVPLVSASGSGSGSGSGSANANANANAPSAEVDKCVDLFSRSLREWVQRRAAAAACGA